MRHFRKTFDMLGRSHTVMLERTLETGFVYNSMARAHRELVELRKLIICCTYSTIVASLTMCLQQYNMGKWVAHLWLCTSAKGTGHAGCRCTMQKAESFIVPKTKQYRVMLGG